MPPSTRPAAETEASGTRLVNGPADAVASYLQLSRGTLIATLPHVDDGDAFVSLQLQLLERLESGAASTVVFDASYVTTVDLYEFGRLRQLLQMVEIMGAHCMLCGVQPAVAATLVMLDAPVDDIDAVGTLDEALDAASLRMRESEQLQAAVDSSLSNDAEPPPSAEADGSLSP